MDRKCDKLRSIFCRRSASFAIAEEPETPPIRLTDFRKNQVRRNLLKSNQGPDRDRDRDPELRRLRRLVQVQESLLRDQTDKLRATDEKLRIAEKREVGLAEDERLLALYEKTLAVLLQLKSVQVVGKRLKYVIEEAQLLESFPELEPPGTLV